jgi:NAD(P)-dependent dehydrogenase (short-subunit alcohol dehydrogenase family)|tara:strand:+ start:233 stop:994 length:762 start_codon:yes stop_codon:yes gene_type:complete
LELENKVSLVTGAGQGIGEGIAKVLASHGSKVMIVDLNGSSAERVANEINTLFPKCASFYEADLTDSKAIQSMIETTLTTYTKLDCICNNAAASKGLGPVENYSLEEVQATLDLTFTSLWKCLQIEIKTLKEQSVSSSIVNISSNSAIRGYAFNSIYAASKAAVNNLTQSVAKEVARNGIRVNAISPGTINTPGVRQYFEAEPKAKDMLEKSSLLRRIGEPEEIGELVSFLLSDRSSFITGQVISVDGGSSIN